MSPSPSNNDRPLRIGMIGAGTVGIGVYELLMNRLGGGGDSRSSLGSLGSNNSTPTSPRTNNTPIITKICVRDADKPRNFQINTSYTEIVTDVQSILNDKEIDIVVEVAGGVTFAKDAVYASIKSEKSVVTSNNVLISENLDEIITLLNEANTKKKNVQFGYEASVCGGIPIIHTLQSAYKGDIINEVSGVVNGTTNFMLDKMEDGIDCEDALQEAQHLGYTEADPTADVEGYDGRAKIAILAKLAFGTTVPVESIPCIGISNVSVVDFEYARSMGCTIKLVGTAMRQSQYGMYDGALSVFVSPKLVPNNHLLASTMGCGNAVVINSANLGTCSYSGPGSGRYQAANSIVADIMRIANNIAPKIPFPLASNIEIDNDYVSAFYIRISFKDGLGIIRSVGELAETQGVSIHSVLQQPIEDRMAADTVVTTESCRLSQIEAFCALIAETEYALCAPVFMPMISDY